MKVDKDLAMKIWKDLYGDQKWATDCFGTWMYRDDYGDQKTLRNNRPGGSGKSFSYGWTIDHIRPQSSFKPGESPDFLNNFEPMHFSNNAQKSDGITFVVDGIKYKVVVCDICKSEGEKGYGIERVSDGKRVDWKAIQRKYYS